MTPGQRIQRVKGIGKWLVQSPQPDAASAGPFAVFDYEGKPAGFFTEYDKAVAEVRDNLNDSGTVFDLSNRTNVSPHRSWRQRFSHFLNPRPLVQLPNLNGGGGPGGKQPQPMPGESAEPLPGRMDESTEQLVAMLSTMNDGSWTLMAHRPDLSQVPEYIRQLNDQPHIPVVDYFNRRHSDLTKEITIQVPVVVERTREVVRNQDMVVDTTKTSWQDVPYPTDTFVEEPIEGFAELGAVPLSLLAQPPEVWAPQVANHELLVPHYQEQVEEPDTAIVQQPVTVQEPYQETVMRDKKVRVPDERRGQTLIILLDWSPSMYTNDQFDCDSRRLPMAVALASVVVGCHLHDGSQYFYRPFTSQVGPMQSGIGEAGKALLITNFLVPPLLGGGTDIEAAVAQAATDIRGKRRTEEDPPEILIITDGQGVVDTQTIRAVIGDDVLLHTVCVNSSNESLRWCSKTYMELLTASDGQLVIRQ